MAKRKPVPDTPAMFEVDPVEREPRATRVKETYRPIPDQMARLHADFPGIDLEEELVKFREWHGARGTKFVNHYLALRTWLRNVKKFEERDRARKLNDKYRPPKAGLTPAPVYNPSEKLSKEPF